MLSFAQAMRDFVTAVRNFVAALKNRDPDSISYVMVPIIRCKASPNINGVSELHFGRVAALSDSQF
jgi:hypothetical protein